MAREIQVMLPNRPRMFSLPRALDRRLQHLLDRNNGSGKPLTSAEKAEAEGLVAVAQKLTIIKLRMEQARKGL